MNADCRGAETTWTGCYDGNWKGVIIPDAYRHPAKFARGLIRRIYQHMIERGYLCPGMTVVDPLGAVDAMAMGLRRMIYSASCKP